MGEVIDMTPNHIKVAIFAFNRPQHLSNCLNSIAKNPNIESFSFVIFVDGPRNEKEKEKVERTIEVAKSYDNILKLEIVTNEKNLGLSRSLIGGINKILEETDKIIVIEDDLIVSKNFLDYMRKGLEKYELDQNVASIHGFTYDFLEETDASYFLRGADCWGWGTWKNRWDSVEWSSEKLAKELKEKKLESSFDLDGAYPYMKLLERQISGAVDSWAIRWHASMFIKNKLTLFPSRSLVENSGFDGSGTHTNQTNNVRKYEIDDIKIRKYPEEVAESFLIRRKFKKFLRRKFHTHMRFTPVWLYCGLRRRLNQQMRKIGK